MKLGWRVEWLPLLFPLLSHSFSRMSEERESRAKWVDSSASLFLLPSAGKREKRGLKSGLRQLGIRGESDGQSSGKEMKDYGNPVKRDVARTQSKDSDGTVNTWVVFLWSSQISILTKSDWIIISQLLFELVLTQSTENIIIRSQILYFSL